jgi:hypothetical protein
MSRWGRGRGGLWMPDTARAKKNIYHYIVNILLAGSYSKMYCRVGLVFGEDGMPSTRG